MSGGNTRQHIKITELEKAKVINTIEELSDWAEFYSLHYKEFLRARGLRIVKAPNATKNLHLVDSRDFVVWFGEPEGIELFVKLETHPQKASYISKTLNEQKATSKAVYNADSASGVPLSTRGYGTSPDFRGLKAYLKEGKLGNGIIPKGYEKEYALMEQLINKFDGEIHTFVTTHRPSDFQNCWRAMGVSDSNIIKRLEELRDELDLTWHHLDNLDKDMKSTFQLVDTKLHDTTLTHLGSNGQAEYIYKTLKNN